MTSLAGRPLAPATGRSLLISRRRWTWLRSCGIARVTSTGHVPSWPSSRNRMARGNKCKFKFSPFQAKMFAVSAIAFQSDKTSQLLSVGASYVVPKPASTMLLT